VLQRTAKSYPGIFQSMGLALFVTQFLLLAILLAVLKDTTLFNTRAFAFALLAATLVWVAAQTRAHMKEKILYVNPQSADAEKPASAGSPS
jgi:ATP synthase protein I